MSMPDGGRLARNIPLFEMGCIPCGERGSVDQERSLEVLRIEIYVHRNKG